jgi:anti-sigma regulatory factor (Ser/Thr protein kinase)/PAS domain-containing protein
MNIRHFSKLLIFILLILSASAELHAGRIDLTGSDLFVRKGFTEEWINRLPEDDRSWTKVSASSNGRRSVRVTDLKLDLPHRSFLSFKSYPAETFTYVTSFNFDRKTNPPDRLYGLYLSQIGMNWEIYLNGHLLKKEMNTTEDGRIYPARNMRDLLIYILPEYLADGKNILAFRIAGDPTYQETGFYWDGQYLIDDYETLAKKNSEMIPIVLIFIYLFIGLYHVYLYSRRTRERYNLFYGLFSILLFFYVLSRSHTVYSMIADTTIITRIELISLYLLLPCMIMFLDLLFKDRFRPQTWVFNSFCALIVIPTIFAPLPTLIDILLIWQIVAIFMILYFSFWQIGSEYIREVIERIRSYQSGMIITRTIRSLIRCLFSTFAGNLLIGATVTSLCGIFDILDAIYFYTGIALLKYGFLLFVVGITLVLARRFQNLFSRVEELNISLQNNIVELNNANRITAVSEEKYRLLVDGSHDNIFTMDNDWKFITANKALRDYLKVEQQSIKGISIFDILCDESESMNMSKRVIREQLETFSSTRNPVQFIVQFKTPVTSEPREFMMRLEYINIEGRNEILGKASTIIENTLLKHITTESQNYRIGNYFITADEVCYRITANLIKYFDTRDISIIRIALREMIINAIEHGNLDITFEEKSRELMNENYFKFIYSRQNNSEYKNRKVDIRYQLEQDKVVYIIRDEGKGFDHAAALSGKTVFDANEGMLAHGRGIIMAKNTFDEVRYEDDGRQVSLIKHIKNAG